MEMETTQTSSQIQHQPHTDINTIITGQSNSLTQPLPPSNIQPVAVKRPTRQWAAWTRQEEESFFTALRLVGKNFEKITVRVQTKNKEQVRHYYYRLVRRINKLLSPSFSLDAKNSKDTNAAMLRWWSLLEKYSCKASKLHLKPRRFKLFTEALEHQLVKDRKKSVRKRSPPGEICSVSLTTSPNDVQAADSQSVERGSNKKGCTKRNLSMGVNHSISKEDSSGTKQSRPRRRSGTISAAAMKRWEKAAMAGVSLVADAAEHLERTASGKENYHHSALNMLSAQAVGCSMEKFDSTLKQLQSPLPNLPKIVTIDNNVQNNIKLKLQLFPIDESTRKALEVDKHNPHLELTLGSRKKISSILEHLDRKWGSSSAANGELMLFPFIVRRENLMKYERWSKDSVATAAEVYALSGTPPAFRLRYGWILRSELEAGMSEAFQGAEGNNRVENVYTRNDKTSEIHNSSVEMNENVDSEIQKNDLGSFPTKRVDNEEIREIPTSAGEWADSLTNVSVGDILADVSDRMDMSCVGGIPFSCDSFDAAIAAHISNQNKTNMSLHSSSIWDAEETCDAFSFQHKTLVNNLVTPTDNNIIEEALMDTATIAAGDDINRAASPVHILQDLQEKDMVEDSDHENQVDKFPSQLETENSAKEFGNLTDIYWPDSLGPLELDGPSCKYYSEDVILSDSLSGLNRLIASSLDAFQNCPFFGSDDKAHSSSSGASGSQGGVSFAGKIGNGGNGAQSLQA